MFQPIETDEFNAEIELGLVLSKIIAPDQSNEVQWRLSEWAASIGNPSNEKYFLKLFELLPKLPVDMPEFRNFAEIDKFMSIRNKRGHHRHQFEVYLLGLNMLYIHWINIESSDREKIFGTTDICIMAAIWRSTSLGHDIGYPVEESQSLLDNLASLFSKIEFMNVSAVINNVKALIIDAVNEDIKGAGSSNYPTIIDHCVQKSLKSSESCIQTKYPFCFIDGNDVLHIEHGYASCIIILMSLCKSFCLGSDNIEKIKQHEHWESIWRILGAISLHTIKSESEEILQKISFDHNPYAYILYIVDNIQDWGRTLFPHPAAKFADCKLSNAEICDNEINLIITFLHDEWSQDIENESIRHINLVTSCISMLCNARKKYKLNIKYIVHSYSISKSIQF